MEAAEKAAMTLPVAVQEAGSRRPVPRVTVTACRLPAVQISTGSACHLDATMIHDALHALDLSQLDLLFIENVGNLVCPAAFDLGAHRSVALLSVPEGDDKPEKYPVMFRAVDLVLLTKTDLLPYISEFDVSRARQSVRSIGCSADVMEVSTRNDAGIDPWLQWLRNELAAHRQRASARAEQASEQHAQRNALPLGA